MKCHFGYRFVERFCECLSECLGERFGESFREKTKYATENASFCHSLQVLTKALFNAVCGLGEFAMQLSAPNITLHDLCSPL